MKKRKKPIEAIICDECHRPMQPPLTWFEPKDDPLGLAALCCFCAELKLWDAAKEFVEQQGGLEWQG